jgi:hypothetical protein
MPADSLAPFLEALRRVLHPAQAGEAASLADRTSDPRALARELVKRGWLTMFQANKLLQGRADALVLGQYVLLDLLGEGGMGQVYKARQTGMNRVVALKVIRGDRLGDPGAVARFKREIEAAGKLTHPNVVRAYDASQVGTTLYFVMEFVPGHDLASLVKERGPLPIAEACDYARQAALGLQHAHEHRLIHRDIKPGNLILADDPAGVVKVLDLGLARPVASGVSTELTPADAAMGTPDYLAPEQGADARAVDSRADIYSLGCTLYHLLTGRVPFPGGTLAQKLQWHQNAEPAALESVRQDAPAALGAVVRKMMAKKPGDRYQTCLEVADALAPFAAGVSSDANRQELAPTQTFIRPEDAPARPRGRGWLVAALLLVVAVGGAVFWLTRGRGSPGQDEKPIEVEVRLVGIARPAEPEVTVILIDGRPIPFDELQKEMRITAGTHVVEIQKNGEVVERREFMVAAGLQQPRLVVPEADREPGPITALSGHQHEVTCVTFSGDGLRLMSVGPNPTDGVFVWNVPTAKLLYHYASPKPPRLIRGHPNCGALSPEGNAALIGNNHAYKTATVKPWVQSLGLDSATRFWETDSHTRKVLAVAFSLDGKLALSSDEAGFTKVWDDKGKRLFQFDGSLAAFSPTADRLAVVQKKQMKVWTLTEPPREVQAFEGHADLIRAVAFAPDGRSLLTCGDTTVRLWDVATGKETRVLRGHTKEVTSAALSPDGRRVLSGSRDSTVRLWDVATETELLRFTQHTDAVTSVAYSPGGRRAASGSLDGTVRLYALPR